MFRGLIASREINKFISIIPITNSLQYPHILSLYFEFYPLALSSLVLPMLEEKLKMSRKKNLSSKIIVDQYDHLIKNSKLQPNFESLLDPPLSPHFITKDLKYILSKQQSSQSQYSLQNLNENQKQCFKCGEAFSLRFHQSHPQICEEKEISSKKQEIKNFIKKDEYNFSPEKMRNHYQGKITSARNGNKNKDLYEPKQVKKSELKKSSSKLSIQSHDKNIIKRPSSSTRNKLDIKGHQNLKEKILSKLQGNRHKNQETKQQMPKRGSSHNKNTLSNSKPKSTNKNINALQNGQKKYNTMNSSITRKNIPHKTMNYEFNRSEIFRNSSSEQKRKQKNELLSKATLKEEKKYTLKKKNINSNNSMMSGPFQKQMQKSKAVQNFNIKENSSYFSQSNQLKNKTHQQHQFLREQLLKQGPFRRQCSTSGSKKKFNRQNEDEMTEKKPYHHHERELNDEYFFFENHPSTVPSHFLKRKDRPNSQYQMEEQNMFEENSSNIIRNKLGLNKFIHKNRPQQAFQRLQFSNKPPRQSLVIQREKEEEKLAKKKKVEEEDLHRRTNTSRDQQDQRNQQIDLIRESRNQHVQRNQPRPQERIQNSQEQRNLQRQHLQPRQRPNNPMGNSRNGPQRMNRAQNRPQPRIANQRINSQNEQRQNTQNPTRNLPQQQNQREQSNRRREQRRRQNPNQNRQTNSSRRQQQGQGSNRRIQQDTLNFISNTLNEQFEVMNEHFNLLNNIFSNFSNIVNVNITASTNNQNPTTFIFRSHGRRRNNNRQNYDDDDSSSTNSEYSDFISDFSEDESLENETDYSEDEYYYEEEQNENPGMTEHEISSIPVLRYSKEKHGSNQCTICLVELVENEAFKKLYCDHVFHTECIDEWLKRKNACPVCRDQMGVRS